MDIISFFIYIACKNKAATLGVSWLAFMFILGCFSVGEMPETNEPFPPSIPFTLLFYAGFPFVLGYFSGKNSK